MLSLSRVHALVLVLTAGACVAIASACDGGVDPAGVGGSSGTLSNTNGTESSGTFAGGTSGTGSTCDLHCSADLKTVLDCNDAVVLSCPPDKGCGAGTCVEPCEAAKLNGSTIGCDFYSIVPAPEYETQGSCFAVLLANTWSAPLKITASYGGATLDAVAITRTPVGSGQSISYQPLTNGELGVGQVGIVFLADFQSGQGLHVSCPAGVTPGITTDASVDKTGIGNAFHITTNAPVIAYDMYPYGGAASYVSSATLLIPTSAWGVNYVAADAYALDGNLAFVNGAPFIQIAASQDDTKVTISPTAAITGGPGVAGTGQGQPATYTLNSGQFIQFLQNEELAGSAIAADKPISTWGGSACMNIPVGNGACDSGHQQLLPVTALGHEYLGVRYRDRAAGQVESVPWRFVGAVNGTSLTYEPSPPPGAPDVLNSGQLVEFNASSPFVVKSQDADHPFYMSGYMTGALAVSTPNNDGDPEYVTVIPPEQYLSSYLFLTDPTYRNTHLVFTRKRSTKDNFFKDVTLDCVGTVGGWQPVGSSGDFEYARVDITINGQPQGMCDNGVHKASSDAAFGLTVWGWDTTVSYAYPAGMSVEPINTVVVPPIPQ